jgi:hypothetical protein
MRLGQNPAKFVQEVARPERITVAVLTYAPFLGGYFARSLDVMQACLESLWCNTDLPHDLLVFDNGSCAEVQSFLRGAFDAGRIQMLFLSAANLGKGGAWNIIFPAAPGEVLAYTDSDALFAPGWLSASVHLLDTYPRVGMVTSRPFRTPETFSTSTLEWAEQTPEVQVERGQFVAWEVFRDFDLSLGQEEDSIRQRYQSTHDTRLTYRGVRAHVGASHWQFVALKSVLQEFLPFEMDRPMGQVRQLDQRVNDAGYLRLMTCEPLAMNMSNTPQADSRSLRQGPARLRGLRRRVLELPPVRRLLLGIHDRIFRWYYGR